MSQTKSCTLTGLVLLFISSVPPSGQSGNMHTDCIEVQKNLKIISIQPFHNNCTLLHWDRTYNEVDFDNFTLEIIQSCSYDNPLHEIDLNYSVGYIALGASVFSRSYCYRLKAYSSSANCSSHGMCYSLHNKFHLNNSVCWMDRNDEVCIDLSYSCHLKNDTSGTLPHYHTFSGGVHSDISENDIISDLNCYRLHEISSHTVLVVRCEYSSSVCGCNEVCDVSPDIEMQAIFSVPYGECSYFENLCYSVLEGQEGRATTPKRNCNTSTVFRNNINIILLSILSLAVLVMVFVLTLS